MTEAAKSLLLVFQHSPYSTTLTLEGLDLALASSAFDSTPSLLFCGDSVFCLSNDLSQTTCHRKNIGKVMDVLSLYDINDVYACRDSLEQRHVSFTRLRGDVQILDAGAIQKLYADHKVVLSF